MSRDANIAKVTDKTIVIPGHGAVGSKADLILFRDVLVEIHDRVAALKKQGKSLPEVVAAIPVIRRKRPPMAEHNRLPGTPVLVVYFSAIFGDYFAHEM